MSTREDVHTPSRIIPSNYEYVAVWTMNIQGIGDAMFMLQERETTKRHMERTKGTYAHIETSGSCQVCGNVQAIYLALFYHEKSNTYVRVGFDCTRKLEMSGDFQRFNQFRRNVQDAREAQAGKKKAIAILADTQLSEAWDIYTTQWEGHLSTCKGAGFNSWNESNSIEKGCDCDHDARWKEYRRWEETTIRDIVGKLVKYGNISDKQRDFIGSLLQKIAQRPILEAQRKAEADAAGPVPTGRVRMQGEVVMVKEYDKPRFHYGDTDRVTKIMVRLDNGSKVMGKRFDSVEKGQRVDFTASVEASKDDTKFGFFKRAKSNQSTIDANPKS